MVETIFLIAVLLAVAMLLVVVEVCTPTFGVLGLVALCATIWAGYLFYTLSPVAGWISTAVLIVAAPIYVASMIKLMPRTALGRWLILKGVESPRGESTPEAGPLKSLVGVVVEAETVLRPSGTIRVDGRRIVAQAEGGMVRRGEKVKIVRTAGNYVVVRREPGA